MQVKLNEKIKVRRKIEVLGFNGEKLKLRIERYNGHDNISIWHKDKELYQTHFTTKSIGIFPINPNAVQYVRISSTNKQISVKRDPNSSVVKISQF